MRGREISKIRFLGQFLTLKNMVLKFSQNSKFSYFLGIKSEIHHSQKVVQATDGLEKGLMNSKRRPTILGIKYI